MKSIWELKAIAGANRDSQFLGSCLCRCKDGYKDCMRVRTLRNRSPVFALVREPCKE
jgi:hypothetical protein